MMEASPREGVALVPSCMEREPEPESELSASADPLRVARQFFTSVKSGGVSKDVHAYALVPGKREADEYSFCRCEPKQDNSCPKCRLQLPDEQLRDGKHPSDFDCHRTAPAIANVRVRTQGGILWHRAATSSTVTMSVSLSQR